MKEQLQGKYTRTKLGRGADGENGVSQLGSSTTCTCTTSQKANESSSSELSPWRCIADVIHDHFMAPWLKEHLEVPFHVWHRHSETTTIHTQQGTKIGGTDGTERVTHENIGGKPARSRVICFGTPQTDGRSGWQ